MDHFSFHQGVPDGGEPLRGNELDEVVPLQVDEAVTPSQVDPSNIDPVEEIPGIVGKVPQFLGQMHVGVEAVGDVEDDLLAGFLGFLA
jgi:hypothetical protein